jgi:hypothetical protein
MGRAPHLMLARVGLLLLRPLTHSSIVGLTEPAAASPRFWAGPAGRLRGMGAVRAESAGARPPPSRQQGGDSEGDSWLEEVLSGGRTGDLENVSVAREREAGAPSLGRNIRGKEQRRAATPARHARGRHAKGRDITVLSLFKVPTAC